MMKSARLAAYLMTLWVLSLAVAQAQGWPAYGGDPGGSRFSALDQINRTNVNDLELAWTYRTGAVKANPALRWAIDFQATPILLPANAGAHLVVCDPFTRVIALNPVTGEERWSFDPKVNKLPWAGRFKCKGVALWQGPQPDPEKTCSSRLFIATADKRLLAIDAATGQACEDFGIDGSVDVDALIRDAVPAEGVQGTQLVSPPAVVGDVVAVSSTSNKFKSAYSVNGMIRGFDARTGKLRWTFDPLVRDESTGLEPTRAEVGGANTWVPMSVDNERDLLFIPTASPAP
ncbi:MAG: PQQ-binding-like beta-propeller repeat protein, partial [Gammaproteobacteria bacterium]